MKLQLAPGKIVVKKVEAKLKGGLELPVSRAKAYDIAEITHVGDLTAFGHKREDKTNEALKPGDIVLFQLPMSVAGLTSHKVKNVLSLFLSVRDVIAKLDSEVVELKNFHIAGCYILLKPQVRHPNSLIVVPDTATEMNAQSLHFSVLQMGADVTVDVTKGMEVFPHKGRLNPLVIDGEEVAFIDQQFIDGVLVPE